MCRYGQVRRRVGNTGPGAVPHPGLSHQGDAWGQSINMEYKFKSKTYAGCCDRLQKFGISNHHVDARSVYQRYAP